jgi:methyl-accepting chemotaxis protein
VAQLSQTTQQNASASEELAATSEEMSGQAEQLQQAMSFFKLSGAGARPSANKTAAARTSRGSQRAAKGRGAPVKSDDEQFVKFA